MTREEIDKAIIDHIRNEPGCLQHQLTQKLGRCRSEINSSVRHLCRRGVIEEVADTKIGSNKRFLFLSNKDLYAVVMRNKWDKTLRI